MPGKAAQHAGTYSRMHICCISAEVTAGHAATSKRTQGRFVTVRLIIAPHIAISIWRGYERLLEVMATSGTDMQHYTMLRMCFTRAGWAIGNTIDWA